jgi:hypothetical protein
VSLIDLRPFRAKVGERAPASHAVHPNSFFYQDFSGRMATPAAHDRRVAMKRLCTLASVAFVFSGSGTAAELTAEIPKDDAAFITKAMTAAPAAIGQKATFVRVGDGYKLTPIRQGTNASLCHVPGHQVSAPDVPGRYEGRSYELNVLPSPRSAGRGEPFLRDEAAG